MTLYEIEQAILDCLDMETGEVLDVEKLDALQMERTAKLEGVALWIKNLEADVEAYKVEMARFAERRKVAENKLDGLKRYLSQALGGQKFQTAKCAVSFRKSVAVEIADEAAFKAYAVANGHADLLTIQEPRISLTGVKNALKDGAELPGAALVERQNIQIK